MTQGSSLLFTDRSLWTMLHGIVLGGSALMALAAALFSLRFMAPADGFEASPGQARALSMLTVFVAALLWLTVIAGTYVVFPPYRATPPEGIVDLARYPRAVLLGSPETAWLHAFAMELKEHVPWIAAMLSTAVAFVATRDPSRLLADRRLRGTATTLTAIVFALVALVSLLGVFINKVAPLE